MDIVVVCYIIATVGMSFKVPVIICVIYTVEIITLNKLLLFTGLKFTYLTEGNC